jgi:hypothetical protein
MSFERFSTSDIYMFEHVDGFIECCGCWLSGLGLSIEADDFFASFSTPRNALAHLDKHEQAGHDIGHARKRIIEEYPDLDIVIKPWDGSSAG